MNKSLDNLAQRSVCTDMLASMALGLCLFVGQGLHLPGSLSEFVSASSESRFATSTPIDSAVTSLERQVRVPSNAPRRHAVLGTLPPCCALDLLDHSLERSLADAGREALTTRSFPNDRAPPPLFA